MDYEQWGAGQFGNDGYNENFGGAPAPEVMPGGFVPTGPSPDQQKAVEQQALAQTRAMLGLGAAPARGVAPQQVASAAPSKATYLVPLVLAGVIGLGYWYWASRD